MKPYDETLLTRIANGEKRIAVCHLTLTDGTKYYFLKSAPGNPDVINGNSYQKRLMRMGGLKESPFTNETNRQEIEISNVNSDGTPGTFGLLTADALRPLKMARVETFEYFPSDNTFLWYYDGFLSQPVATEQKIKFTVVDAATAAGFVFATKTVSARNGFVNPDPEEQVAPSGGTGLTIGGGTHDPFCFARGTKVYSDFNTLKPNHKFVVGDAILSFNPETLIVEIDKVKQVFSSVQPEYIRITFADRRVLKVTPEHPFFYDGFTKAKHLKAGQNVYRYQNGCVEVVKVKAVALVDAPLAVINFSVEKNRTYLPKGFLVSNRKTDPIEPGGINEVF